MSIEGTANTEYASLSGKIRTFVVDKTLTISGACADAKATGEAIESKAGEAAKDAVSEQLPAAVTAGVIAELPKFLDDTLTKTDKAAQAAAVRSLVNERAQVVCGSYEGTGGYGKDNLCTLTFDFIPRLVVVGGGGLTDSHCRADITAVRGAGSAINRYSDHYGALEKVYLIWGDKSVSWYSSESAQYQSNSAGETYNYVAIG